MQDAFGAMSGGWQRLGDADKALAYLRQSVVNRSRSVLRHRTLAGSDPQEVLPDTPAAQSGAPGLLEQPAARAALRGLPDRQREAIVLRYYAGLSQGLDLRHCGLLGSAVSGFVIERRGTQTNIPTWDQAVARASRHASF